MCQKSSVMLSVCICAVILVPVLSFPTHELLYCSISTNLPENSLNSSFMIDRLDMSDFIYSSEPQRCLQYVTFYDIKVSNLDNFSYCVYKRKVDLSYPEVKVAFTYNDTKSNEYNKHEVLSINEVNITLYENDTDFLKNYGEYNFNFENENLHRCIRGLDILAAIGGKFVNEVRQLALKL